MEQLKSPASNNATASSSITIPGRNVPPLEINLDPYYNTKAAPGAHKLQWEQRYAELIEYKNQHGNCNVSKKNKSFTQLGDWVSNQRVRYRKGNVPQERVDKLNAIGFVWEVQATGKDTWMERYNELVQYKSQNGHCNVPQKDETNPQLSNWVMTQRRKYKLGKLSEEHTEKLNEIGFTWELAVRNHADWDTRYNELVEYKNQHGTCNVQRKHSPPHLINWIMTQRSTFHKGKLSADRIAKLNAIDFSWEGHVDWTTRYEQLVAYKALHGNCNVPTKYDENPKLGDWVHTQRQYFKQEKLTVGQIAKLNEIGFVWEVTSRVDWMVRYNELVAYKNEHGDCNVPQVCKANPQLGYWVRNQRQKYKKGKLADDRVDLLNSIDFEW